MDSSEWNPLLIGLGVWAGIILAFVTLPAQIFLTAIIGFGATFSGVFVSFRVERQRKEREDRDHFGRTIQGVLVESFTNEATLNNIEANPRAALILELHSHALEAALRDHLFNRWAGRGLLVTAHTARDRLALVNNILLMHRQAITTGTTITTLAVSQTQIHAQAARETSLILQELLHELMTSFGARIQLDPRAQEIENRHRDIRRRRDERLQEVARQASHTGENAEQGTQ